MSLYSIKGLAGAAMALTACLAAVPAMARPLNQADVLLSQVNKPTEGTPSVTATQVQGRITKIDGDKVEVRTANGQSRTFSITKADQDRNRLQVGSTITLTVRGETVVAISPVTTNTTSSGTTNSGSSTTTIRRQTTTTTTVQQSRPAASPAPTPKPSPSPDTVRGLW